MAATGQAAVQRVTSTFCFRRACSSSGDGVGGGARVVLRRKPVGQAGDTRPTQHAPPWRPRRAARTRSIAALLRSSSCSLSLISSRDFLSARCTLSLSYEPTVAVASGTLPPQGCSCRVPGGWPCGCEQSWASSLTVHCSIDARSGRCSDSIATGTPPSGQPVVHTARSRALRQ